MDLLDRYVEAVRARLPRRTGDDIARELRSLIMDMLQARCQETDPGEEDVVEVLRQLGRPQDVADRYAPTRRYLIGPRLFDTYLLVAVIVSLVTGIGVTVALLTELAFASGIALSGLFRMIPAVASAALGAFGAVTAVFAVLERVVPEGELEGLARDEGEWDPRRLPPANRQRVGMGGSVAAICFTLLGLAAFNLLLDSVASYYHDGAGWQVISLLNTEAIVVFRPYLNALWIALLVHHSLLLARGSWSAGSRKRAITLGCASIAVMGFMLGPPLVDPAAFPEATIEGLGLLADLAGRALQLGLLVGMAATLAEVVGQVLALLRLRATSNPR